MFLPRSGSLWSGRIIGAYPAHLPPAVKPLDLVAILYGNPWHLQREERKRPIDGNRFRLDVYAQGTWAQSLWVDPVTGRLVKVKSPTVTETRHTGPVHDAVEVGSLTVPAESRSKRREWRRSVLPSQR